MPIDEGSVFRSNRTRLNDQTRPINNHFCEVQFLMVLPGPAPRSFFALFFRSWKNLTPTIRGNQINMQKLA